MELPSNHEEFEDKLTRNIDRLSLGNVLLDLWPTLLDEINILESLNRVRSTAAAAAPTLLSNQFSRRSFPSRRNKFSAYLASLLFQSNIHTLCPNLLKMFDHLHPTRSKQWRHWRKRWNWMWLNLRKAKVIYCHKSRSHRHWLVSFCVRRTFNAHIDHWQKLRYKYICSQEERTT